MQNADNFIYYDKIEEIVSFTIARDFLRPFKENIITRSLQTVLENVRFTYVPERSKPMERAAPLARAESAPRG